LQEATGGASVISTQGSGGETGRDPSGGGSSGRGSPGGAPVGGSAPVGGAAGASGGQGAGAPAAGGTSGAARTPDAGPSRGPTPPRGGTSFPFPQNRESSRCVYPRGYRNEGVQAAYEKWRTDTVTANGASGHLRVQRPNEPGLEQGSTVSEG